MTLRNKYAVAQMLELNFIHYHFLDQKNDIFSKDNNKPYIIALFQSHFSRKNLCLFVDISNLSFHYFTQQKIPAVWVLLSAKKTGHPYFYSFLISEDQPQGKDCCFLNSHLRDYDCMKFDQIVKEKS